MAVNRLSRPTARALQCSYLKSGRFLSSSLGKGFTDADEVVKLKASLEQLKAENRATEAKLEERLRAAQAKSGDRWHAFFNIFNRYRTESEEDAKLRWDERKHRFSLFTFITVGTIANIAWFKYLGFYIEYRGRYKPE